MKKQFAWHLGIFGLALLIIGLVSVTAPNMNVQTLMMYFGVMLLIIGGVEGIICILLRKKLNSWLWLLFVAAFFAVTGYYTIKHTQQAGDKFKLIMAAWAVLVGVIQLVLSFRNKGARIFLVSVGIISLFFGSLIFMNPFNGPNTILFMAGFYTLILSFFILYMSYRMLKTARPSTPLRAGAGAKTQS